MELYKEILISLLARSSVEVSFSGLNGDIAALVEAASYQALQRIKAAVHDDSLDDPECFRKVEEIIRVLEDIGSDGGSRHDF